MTRQAERVRHHPVVTGQGRTESGWWSSNRSVMVPAVLLALVVAGVVAAVDRYGVDILLQVAGLAALLVIAVGVAAVGALALVLRRRLRELRHLPDLGRSYVTNHEDALVTGLFRDSAGDVVLEVMSGTRQTIVLDESGAPDHITPGGATTSRFRIPGSAAAEPEVLHRIEALFTEQVPVRVVSEGVVVLTGPVLGTWRLESADGLVLTSQG